MADPERLTPKHREFIESMGVFFAHYGLPRLAGRLLGLLMLTDRPLTLDDMAQALLVSRASVSTNIRIALANSYVMRVGVLGDRRDFYAYNEGVWERRTMLIAEGARASRIMAERGLEAIRDDDVTARERLEEMCDYCDFSIEEAHNMQEHWRERKRAAKSGPIAPIRHTYTALPEDDEANDDSA